MNSPLEILTVRVPGGEVVAVVDPDDGAVVASGFGSVELTLSFLTDADRARGHRQVETSAATAAVVDALTAYADGRLDALDAVAVRQAGGPFQQRAWTELRGIPAGQTDSYAGLAQRAGSPAAVRAAGQACARNRVAPFVPCHRILRTDGTLGGYAYGLPVKQALLAHEGARPS